MKRIVAAGALALALVGTPSAAFAASAPPTVDNANLFTEGYACSPTPDPDHPVPDSPRLQARVEGDVSGANTLTTEFAVRPVADPSARATYVTHTVLSGLVTTAVVPRATLTSGQAYGWQARVSEGSDVSAWSTECYFAYDSTPPSTPSVTSDFPSNDYGPIGTYPTFTFDAHGDRDVIAFVYGWDTPQAPNRCPGRGEYGQDVCVDLLSGPNLAKPDVPGGTASVTLNPDTYATARLSVLAIDRAGNASAVASADILLPNSVPSITVQTGNPVWNHTVTFAITPAAGLTGVTGYQVVRDGVDGTTTVVPGADGTAYYSFVATDPFSEYVTVRSVSADGFVSAPNRWSVLFQPEPGVNSDDYPRTGGYHGGVGVPGTFTFSPPPGWTAVASYRYAFDDGDPIDVVPGPDGDASITWTPTSSGAVTLTVSATAPDGTTSDQDAHYRFGVA